MNNYQEKKVPAGRLYYRLCQMDRSHHSWGQFLHPQILVGMTTGYSATRDISVKLQGDKDRETYYGLQIEAVARLDYNGGEDQLKLALKLLRTIDQVRTDNNALRNCDLLALRAALTKLKAIEATYDPRISEIVAVKDVLPEAYCSWRDDYLAMGAKDGCSFSAIARDMHEARAIMTVKHKADEEGSYGHERRTQYFEQWTAAGQPVMRLDSNSWGAPTIYTWESYDIRPKVLETETA